MQDHVDPPVPHPFAINLLNISLTMVLMFPLAGWLSDVCGRKCVMTAGAAGMALLAPPAMAVIGQGDFATALAASLVLGALLCLYAAPLFTFLVERFPRQSRMTAVALGYNTACAVAGGLSPAAVTQLVRKCGPVGARYLLSTLAVVSLIGIHCLTSKHDCAQTSAERKWSETMIR